MKTTLIMGTVLVSAAFLAMALGRDGGAGMMEEKDPVAERAAAQALSCAACHGTGGALRTAIPLLAGQPEMVLRAQLLAFKRDEFPGATVMPRLAKGYSEEELAALAAYFSSLPPAGID